MNYHVLELRQTAKGLTCEVIHKCQKDPWDSFEEVLIFNQLLEI